MPRNDQGGFGAATDDPKGLLARAREQMKSSFDEDDPIGVRLAGEAAWLAVASTADVAAARMGQRIPGGRAGRESVLREIERCAHLRTGSLTGTFRMIHDDLHGSSFYGDNRPSRDHAEYLIKAAEEMVQETLRGADRCSPRGRRRR